jgi:hypothetical protein
MKYLKTNKVFMLLFLGLLPGVIAGILAKWSMSGMVLASACVCGIVPGQMAFAKSDGQKQMERQKERQEMWRQERDAAFLVIRP